MQRFKKCLDHPAARPLLFVVAVLVVLAVVAGARHFSKPASPFATVDACDILTASVAHQVGGNSLAEQSIAPQKTADTETTYCVYRSMTNTVALIVRSPKTQKGISENKAAFSPLPDGAQRVLGYGDTAYWAPNFAQFNILSHDRWYIVSNGPDTPTQRTLTQSKTLADKIINQL